MCAHYWHTEANFGRGADQEFLTKLKDQKIRTHRPRGWWVSCFTANFGEGTNDDCDEVRRYFGRRCQGNQPLDRDREGASRSQAGGDRQCHGESDGCAGGDVTRG